MKQLKTFINERSNDYTIEFANSLFDRNNLKICNFLILN